MLDAEKAHLTEFGKVVIDHEMVVVVGFDGENASCRDVATLAMVWAIGRLQEELRKTLEQPGGGNVAVG